VVAVLAAGAAVLLVGGGAGDPHWRDGTPAAAPTPEPTTERADTPGARRDRDVGPTGPTGSPPPYVHSFAQQPGVTPRTPLPSPTAGLKIDEGTDGCDHAYGDRNVCVPWTFPDGVTDKCGWLRERGYEPLRITGGRDRHGLDRNGDGIACGAGD